MAYDPWPTGQKPMSSSKGVVIASDQTPVSVAGTVNIGNNASVSGTVGASIIGRPPVAVTNTPSISGTVDIGVIPGSVVAFQGTNPWIITGSVQGSFTPSGNQSVSGTVGASIIGLPPVNILGGISSVALAGANTVSVVGTVFVAGSVATTITPVANQSVSGTVGASIIGLPPVNVTNTVNVSGSVAAFITGNASIIAVTQSSVAVAIVSGSIAASFTPPANQSVSGTVGASVVGTVPTTQSGTQITSLVSIIPSSVLVGASIYGTAPVTQAGTWIASVFGNVSVIGTVPVTQAGPWSVSVVGTIGASVIGLTPVNIVGAPSIYGNISGSVVAFQGGTNITSVLNMTTGGSSTYAVLSSITAVSIMTANTVRRGATIYNNAGTTVFIRLGVGASTSVFTIAMQNQDYYELPFGWTSVVSGISASNAGVVTVTELT